MAALLVVGLVATACTGSSTPRAETTGPATSSTAPGSAIAPATTSSTTTTVDPAIGVSTDPVIPAVVPVRSTFEGLEVLSYIPDHPVGLVFVFHGAGGSADFATKLETTDVLNELTARGYGYVATEGTERVNGHTWDPAHTTTADNPDLARVVELRQHLVDTTPVEPDTPVYGIGMSNGGAFTALWATWSEQNGQPVAAVAMYMIPVPASVRDLGGMTVPTFMVVAQNDTLTDPTRERADLARIQDSGVAAQLREVTARPVLAERFLRIPGVDATMAQAILTAYQQAGVLGPDGAFVPAAAAQVFGPDGSQIQLDLPDGLTAEQRRASADEVLASVAAHQFNAEFKVDNADFFDAHR